MTLLALVVLPGIARADGYSNAAYSGGTFTVNGASYPDNGGSGAVNGNSLSCSGTITATFKWSGATLPQSVIVVQSATASAGALREGPTGNDPTAACADGLGDTCSIATTSPSPPPGSEGKSGTASKTKYTVQSGSSPLTLTCPASASATLPASQQSASASVSYSASVYPITVQLTGTTSDGKGGQDLLTGQQCTASLAGLPSGTGWSVLSYAWSVSGGMPFETYDINAPNATHTTQLVPLSAQDMYAPNFSFYDGKNGDSITVICGAVVMAPDGTQLTVTAQSTPIKVLKPQVASWVITGGIVRAPQGIAGLFPIPGDSIHKSGQSWHDISINVPAPFSGGTFDFAQVITPTRQIYRNLPQGSNASAYYHVQNSGTAGLDTIFPYDRQFSIPSQPTVELSGDSPQVGVPGENLSASQLTVTDNGGSDWYKTTASDQFTTWLIYLPPAVGNQGTVWVPLQKYDWNWSGTEEIQDGLWTFTTGMPTTPSTPSPSNTDTPPVWTVTHKGTDSYSP